MDRSIEELNRYQAPLLVRSEVRIYSNPFSEVLIFEIFGIEDEQLEIEVYNQLGQLVFLENKHILRTGKQFIIWTPELLSTELYFYRIFINREEYANGVIFRQ